MLSRSASHSTARKPFGRPLTLVLSTLFSMALLAGLAGCTVQDFEAEFPTLEEYEARQLEGDDERLFGDLIIGGPPRPAEVGAGATNVNLYLWRAALETLSIGPLSSADPFGGVIITDWFTMEEDPDHQYRITAYILGRDLRTDNLRVALYIRPQTPDAAATRASPAAETRMENVILAKAREIRAGRVR